jgi:phosphatidylserine decarboxylase
VEITASIERKLMGMLTDVTASVVPWMAAPWVAMSCVVCTAFAGVALMAMEWQVQQLSKRIAAAGNPAKVTVTPRLVILRFLFERRRMGFFAGLCGTELPLFLRVPLLRVVAQLLSANVGEAREPLETYRTIGDFFSRELKAGARTIFTGPGALVSPVDAKLLALGLVKESAVGNQCGPRAWQVEVKGTSYSLTGLLGFDPTKSFQEDSELVCAAFHLGAGDYHRFHAPAGFQVQEIRRFAGEGLPVMPFITGQVSDVFSVNERLVISGKWNGGQLHMVAVGAAHVRGIFLCLPGAEVGSLAEVLAPPSADRCYYLDGQSSYARLPGDGVLCTAGAMMGGFHLGSAIVLVCEAPAGSAWKVSANDRVRVGQPLFSFL